MKKIEQNKKIVAIIITVVFVVSFASVYSYAYTDNSTNGINFSDQPLAYNEGQYSSKTDLPNWTALGHGSDRGGDYIFYASGDDNNKDVYYFAVYANNSYTQYFVSQYQTKAHYGMYWAGNPNYAANPYMAEIFLEWTNSQTNQKLYYRNGGMQSPDIYDCPVFSSVNDGMNAVLDWIENPPPPPVEAHYFAGSLAPGHVAVFDIGGLSDIEIVLGTTLFSGYKYSNFSTSQAAGMTPTMPTSISLPLSYTSSISWQGSGQKNLIGQYSNFAFTEHVTSTFSTQYYVVVNPLSGSAPTNTALEASPSNRNNNITILIDKVKSYKTFSLTESFEIGNNGWSEDTSSNGSTTSGTFDDTTGAWSGTNDQTGQPENFNDLPVGGGNSPLVGGNNSINDWLQDIANSIKGFFSGAIGAVTTLVSSGSAFINQLANLYSWLPPAVYSVLVSALVIVITIGVIKVFI